MYFESPGCSRDCSRADDGAMALRAAGGRLQPVGRDPVRVRVEQPGELARVRRQDERRLALDGLEAVEAVSVDDDRHVDRPQELPHERARLAGAAEAGADGDCTGALEPVKRGVVWGDALATLAPELERERLGDGESRARHRERDVARVRPQGRPC